MRIRIGRLRRKYNQNAPLAHSKAASAVGVPASRPRAVACVKFTDLAFCAEGSGVRGRESRGVSFPDVYHIANLSLSFVAWRAEKLTGCCRSRLRNA